MIGTAAALLSVLVFTVLAYVVFPISFQHARNSNGRLRSFVFAAADAGGLINTGLIFAYIFY